MAWKIYDDTVEMIHQRFRYFPDIFLWRGRRYRVQTVKRCWTVSRRARLRRAARHYFQVECVEGEFELFQDVQDGTWHLRRARLEPARMPVVREPVPVAR